MSRHLLGVLEPSVVFQVNRDAGCPPGVTSGGGTPMDRWFLSEYCLFTKQKRHLERKSCQSIRERP
jgi:hypothetical protein